MEKFTFGSAVRGYHVYKVVWKPTIGEKLQADQELGNEADKFADRQRDCMLHKVQ